MDITALKKPRKPRTKKIIPVLEDENGEPIIVAPKPRKPRTKKIIPVLEDENGEPIIIQKNPRKPRTKKIIPVLEKTPSPILSLNPSLNPSPIAPAVSLISLIPEKIIIQNDINERIIEPPLLFTDISTEEVTPLETSCKESKNKYSKSCNDFLIQKEIKEREESVTQPPDDFLYPTLNDKNFNAKIAEKKEFQETKYDGSLHEIVESQEKNEENFDEFANKIINADFELAPHQHFVRNYLSFQTPYNSLLLFHGLGSGKTLTAIGIAEEMREYLKRIGVKKKIIIVASSNVVDNFKLQLFDEAKMSKTQPWTMNNIIGNQLINEVNPTNIRVSRATIVKEVNRLIKKNYKFYGYVKFAHRINEVIGDDMTDISVYNLRREFNNSLIIIDEIQNMKNITDSKNGKDKIASKAFQKLVKNANNLRLLFLTATPMFNSCKELVWILNMMNMNDRRSIIRSSDVFDNNDDLIDEDLLTQKATGYVSYVRGENPYTFPFRVYPSLFSPEHTYPRYLFPTMKMNGNPIPAENIEHAFSLYLTEIGSYQNEVYNYILQNYIQNKNLEEMESFGYTILQPLIQTLIIAYPGLERINTEISSAMPSSISSAMPSSISSAAPSSISSVVSSIISSIVPSTEASPAISSPSPVIPSSNSSLEEANENIPAEEEEEEEEEEESDQNTANSDEMGGGAPAKGVNSPAEDEELLSDLDADVNTEDSELNEQLYGNVRISELYGHKGLSTVMSFNKNLNYEYKAGYGAFFDQDNIGKYSSKIKSICDTIHNKQTGIISEGIILIYSQYLYGGLIPMALALEEMGFTRYGSNSLFKTPPTAAVDVRTMESTKRPDFKPAKYIMITGDSHLSPNNDGDVKAITNIDNIFDEVKNIDISGEKIKVVLISQSGSEGIDFKAIRQVHILEPWYNMNRIEQVVGRAVRNLSHKWLPLKKRNVQIFLHGTVLSEKDKNTETADVYIYRVAEFKAKQIGVVTRLLKKTAVDCILNHDQTNFSQQKINTTLDIILSTQPKVTIPFQVGDSPYSMTCDYMEDCDYQCSSVTPTNTNEYTYGEAFANANIDTIINRIKGLFKERFFYKKLDLIKRINPHNRYSIIQIYAALTHVVDDRNIFIKDKYERNGHLVNIGEYYLFQPNELDNKNISLYDRSVPIKALPEKIDIIRDITPAAVPAKAAELLKIQSPQVERANVDTKYGKLVSLMKSKYDLSMEIFNKTEKEIREIPKVYDGEEVWIEKHIILGIVMYNLSNYSIFIRSASDPVPRETLQQMLVEHIIDDLLPDEKILLLQYSLDIDEYDDTDDFIKILKLYCDSLLIRMSGDKGSIAFGYISYKAKPHYYMFHKDTNTLQWNRTEVNYNTADYSDSQRMLKQKSEDLSPLMGKLFNSLVGFIDMKDNNIMVFKTKITEKQPDVKRTPTGRICNKSTNKTQMTETLNEIVNSKIYQLSDTTKPPSQYYNYLEVTPTYVNLKYTNESELCYICEFILRYYEKVNKENKIWFLNYELQNFIQFVNMKPVDYTMNFVFQPETKPLKKTGKK